MHKNVRVYTNDPKNDKITLQIGGKVKIFADVRPSKVFLKGEVGQPLSQTVTILPGEDESFKILQVNALKGGDFTYHLEEAEIEGRKGFILTVKNVRETEGRYFDKIFMITDRTDQAPLSVIVSGYLTNPRAAEPQGDLPASPPEPRPAPAAD